MRALACGLATLDVTQVVARVPAANDKVVARSTSLEAGGPALNAALTCAALRVATTLVTAVGDGVAAEVVRADCARYGVRLADVADPASGWVVPVSTVLVTEGTGERAVVSRNAVGMTAYAACSPQFWAGLLDGVGAVLVDGHHLPVGIAAAREARGRGIPVLLDGGSWKPGLEELLPWVDVAVVSADFAVPGGGDGDGEALLALGPAWVARTAGAEPVRWWARDGGTGTVPVPRVRVVDTLGAGDVLHGALLAEMARTGRSDLPGALARAVAVASTSVQAPGARGWLKRERASG